MKICFFCFSILLTSFAFSQPLYLYQDTINKFSITVPENWQYQAAPNNSGTVKFLVLAPIEEGKFRANYNVNVLPLKGSSLDSSFKEMVATISANAGFLLLNSGDTTINSIRYRWLEERHTNRINGEPMATYIYLGFSEDKAFMVTFAASTEGYPGKEKLFKLIGSTFRTLADQSTGVTQ